MLKRMNRLTKVEQAIKDNPVYKEADNVKEFVKELERMNIEGIVERSKDIKTVRELMSILTTEELHYLLSLEDDLLERDI